MKIAHYIRSLDPSLGGVVAHVSDLAVLTGAAGADVRIISSAVDPHPANLDGAPGVELVGVDRPAIGGKACSRRQIDEIMAHMEDADLIHLHAVWVPVNMQLGARAHKRGRPYVATPHGMLDDWCMSHHPLRKRLFMSIAGSRFLRQAERVFLCAAGELEQSARWLGGTPGSVIPAAMDISPFEVLPGPDLAVAKTPGADANDPVILFLSRIHPKKGLEVLIDAAADLVSRGRAFHVIVAGTGEDRYVSELKTRIRQRGVTDRFTFAGLVRGDEKVSLYQRAAAMVLPTWQENFGLVLTESLAARTPVITTKGVDIWPEIEACNGGLIVDRTPAAFADAIEQIIDDPQTAQQMGETGRNWVMRDMHPDVLARAFLEVYAEVCGAAMPSPRQTC